MKNQPPLVARKGLRSVFCDHLVFRLRYWSTALRMNVLLGISPRALSVSFTSESGNVIPTFSILSSGVVRIILVLYTVPLTYKYFVPMYVLLLLCVSTCS